MKTRDIIYTIRIDSETKKKMNYLKKHKVSFTSELHDVIKSYLHSKCLEFYQKQNKERCPFSGQIIELNTNKITNI